MHFSTALALGSAFFGPVLADPGVSPSLVAGNVDPGTSFEIQKTVTTLEIPPKADVVLLIDTTGSMSTPIADVKKNLVQVIAAVGGDSQFGLVTFRDLRDAGGFNVNLGLTPDDDAVQDAVNALVADGGRGPHADWLNALYQVSTGAVTFRDQSSRIAVLIGDEPSFDPSGGHSLQATIDALKDASIRVIAANIRRLDADGQATDVTAATGGKIVPSNPGAVTNAIISGLKNLPVTVRPSAACDAGLTLDFDPPKSTVSSGEDASFLETISISPSAPPGELFCSVNFLLNDASGGPAFVQAVNLTVARLGCDFCDPTPGKNLCDETASCAPTPYGTMCLTRPGYKADGAADGDLRVQWRLVWPVPGHEHRVAVKPGTRADTLCDEANKGPEVCKEVKVADCGTAVEEEEKVELVDEVDGQKVLGDEEL